MRLAAYRGVLAARVDEEERAANHGGGQVDMSRRRGQAARTQNDPNLVSKLAGEGWLEHRIVEGA